MQSDLTISEISSKQNINVLTDIPLLKISILPYPFMYLLDKNTKTALHFLQAFLYTPYKL